MSKKKISVLVGSLRKGSFNQKIANEVKKLAPSNLELEFLEIDDLVHYNEDLDHGNPPREWAAFREKNQKFRWLSVLYARIQPRPARCFEKRYRRGLPPLWAK